MKNREGRREGGRKESKEVKRDRNLKDTVMEKIKKSKLLNLAEYTSVVCVCAKLLQL